MKETRLIVEFYKNGELVFAKEYQAEVDEEFVYADSFKVKASDTRLLSENEFSSIEPCDHRVVVVDDDMGMNDSRFILL